MEGIRNTRDSTQFRVTLCPLKILVLLIFIVVCTHQDASAQPLRCHCFFPCASLLTNAPLCKTRTPMWRTHRSARAKPQLSHPRTWVCSPTVGYGNQLPALSQAATDIEYTADATITRQIIQNHSTNIWDTQKGIQMCTTLLAHTRSTCYWPTFIR